MTTIFMRSRNNRTTSNSYWGDPKKQPHYMAIVSVWFFQLTYLKYGIISIGSLQMNNEDNDSSPITNLKRWY